MDRMNEGELTPQELEQIALARAQGAPDNIPQMKLDKLARHRGESFRESQKSPAERVKHRLTTVAAKGDTNYPKVKYHPHKEHIVVRDAKDEAERAPAEQGWVDSPDEFPPSAVRELANDEKLAMFEQMAEILGVAEGESPVDALLAFKSQYNEIAAKLAAAAAGDNSAEALIALKEQVDRIAEQLAAEDEPEPKKKGR